MKKLIIFISLFIFASNGSAQTCRNLFYGKFTQPQLQSKALDFFVSHLRVPTEVELANEMNVTRRELKQYIDDFGLFWQTAVNSRPQKIDDARAILVRAYGDLLVLQKGITPRSASDMEIFNQLLKNSAILAADAQKGFFELKHLLRILGLRQRQASNADAPQLFEGLDALRLAAKEKFPSRFKGMRDQRFGKDYNVETMNLLINKFNGGIAVAYRGITNRDGSPSWSEEMLTSLLAIAKARNLLLLVKEVNGETDLLPVKFIDHPQIRIVTHDIDLGPELRIWGSMVIIPTNKNVLTGLFERAMGKRNQTQIVFGTQRTMGAVATGKNHFKGTHMVWSTGVINKDPVYPYGNFRSSRVSNMASEREQQAAILFEKSDATAGPLGRGAPGRWHITNLDFKESDKPEWGAGIADRMTYYPGDGSKPRPIGATGGVPGDVHESFKSELFVRAFMKLMDYLIAQGTPLEYIRLHDLMDMNSISPWDRPGDRAGKYIKGVLDMYEELNRARRLINDLQIHYPNLKVLISAEDNHNAWINRQLDNTAAIDDPVNGPLLVKLRSIRDSGQDVLEYLFRFQKEADLGIPDQVLMENQMSRNVYIDHPENVRVFKRGENQEIEGVEVANHGDVTDRGQKGGRNLEPHARALEAAVVAHTHELGIVGNIFNPGMIILLRSQNYALRGYSAQQGAIVLIYANGGMQMLIFDPQIGSLFPNLKAGILRGISFFTGIPFVKDDSNDLVADGVTTLNNYDSKPVTRQ